jgi:hypothetical protein
LSQQEAGVKQSMGNRIPVYNAQNRGRQEGQRVQGVAACDFAYDFRREGILPFKNGKNQIFFFIGAVQRFRRFWHGIPLFIRLLYHITPQIR